MKKKLMILVVSGVLFIIVGVFLNFYFERSLIVKEGNSDEVAEDDIEDVTLGDISVPDDIISFHIGEDEFIFSKGDSLTVNFWDEEDKEIFFNDKQFNSVPILYGNLTIGSTAEDVISTFNIQPGYANINMEVDTEEEDGTTDVVDFSYEDNSFLQKDFLDAYITFGYKMVDGSWKMVKADDLMELVDSDQTEEMLVFVFDINGLDDEAVSIGQVIKIYVEYFS